MIRALKHRGPDHESVWIGEGLVLAHRRLSIIDLSEAGAQPMVSDCGRYVISYNGEIYNHLALRDILAAEGAAPAWRGHSDTETLLAGIAHWGLDETLRKTRGMFAIALFDKRQRRLSLARDRMGEKPLYWGWAGKALVFGSELKAIRSHPDAPGETDREALALFLQYAYVPAPRSIHPGLFKLEPGTILETTLSFPAAPPAQALRPGDRHGELFIRQYWSIEETIAKGAQRRFFDDAEAVTEIERTLGDSIERQMLADVPLGAFLSGGVDSSLIVALMQARSTSPIRTFTIGVENAAYNEAPHAAAVAHHLGTDHTEVTVTEAEAQQVIPMLPTLYDEPFADSSQIPTFLVSKAARAQVAVALTGDAGDELFCGYDRYFWGERIWNRISWMPYPARAALGASIGTVPVSTWDRTGAFLNLHAGRNAGLGDKVHRLASRMRWVRTSDDLYRSLVTDWPDGALVAPIGAQPDVRQNDPTPSQLRDDPVGRMMLQDVRSYLPDDILCKVDRAAMGVSLETRVPFLDPDVIDIAARLPPSMRARDGRGKWALRQILYKHVPQELIDRPKSGFGIPIGAWLRGPLRDWAEALLAPEALARSGLMAPGPIRTAWAEHLSGRRDWTQRLWIVLMVQAWEEHKR
jgi:asparagine synthase (glutamine-hydrolysing)